MEIIKESLSLMLKKFHFGRRLLIERGFKKAVGYELNLRTPKTFNEKIQFRKLYDKNPLYSLCSDKYKVREYVEKKIGKKYLIPLYFVVDRLTEEHWDKLPNQCVIKANHNSGPVQIVSNKHEADKNKIIKEINRQLKEKYGTISMESYYDRIDPMIIVEKLLTTEEDNIPEDYKFHCFNKSGEFKCFIQIITERKNDKYKANFYTEKWESLGFHLGGNLLQDNVKKPSGLEEMIKIAKKLSEDFDYVRVDLFNLGEKIYFGELTFCPNSGMQSFKPDKSWDVKFGSYWNL